MTPAWVLVTGDFTQEGGQDKANHALAEFLASRGETVHLVAHRVDQPLASRPSVTVHLVPRPLGSHFLGQGSLDRAGRRVATEVTRAHPGARVIVNGGNCTFPDVCWVHMVHAAWTPLDPGAPLAFKAKHRLASWYDRRRELRALSSCKLVIANSERTRRDLLRLGVSPERVQVVYLGCDPEKYALPDPEESRAARARLGVTANALLVVFVGALGYERKKGFDTLLASWRRLTDTGFEGRLLAAGGGALPFWQSAIHALGLDERVMLLGATGAIRDLLAAADLLVSPTRYDGYGLNVQEALCRGVPAIVSTCAGVAERYPAALHELLLPDPEDASDLASRIQGALEGRARLLPALTAFGESLRAWSWQNTAASMVELIERTG